MARFSSCSDNIAAYGWTLDGTAAILVSGHSLVPFSCKKNVLTRSSCHGTISAHAAAIPAGIGATVGVDAMFENSRSTAVHERQ